VLQVFEVAIFFENLRSCR